MKDTKHNHHHQPPQQQHCDSEIECFHQFLFFSPFHSPILAFLVLVNSQLFLRPYYLCHGWMASIIVSKCCCCCRKAEESSRGELAKQAQQWFRWWSNGENKVYGAEKWMVARQQQGEWGRSNDNSTGLFYSTDYASTLLWIKKKIAAQDENIFLCHFHYFKNCTIPVSLFQRVWIVLVVESS